MVTLDTTTIVLIIVFGTLLFWLCLSVLIGIVANTKRYRVLENDSNKFDNRKKEEADEKE